MLSDNFMQRLRCVALFGLLFSAACGDDPAGPGSNDPFDPEQSSDDFAAVQTALEANADVAEDLGYVAGVLDTLPSSAWVFTPPSVEARPELVRAVRTSLRSVSGSARPILPADVLGATFEWNETENGYEKTERAGAPADGVRFILYDRTSVPLVENGFVDLTDESSPSADRLNVHLEKNGLTRLDYDITVTQTTDGGAVTINGYVTDGTDQVDFDVLEGVTVTSDGFVVDLDYSLALSGQPISVSLETVVSFGETISSTFVAAFVNGANTLVMDMTQDGQGAIDGTVHWNGDLVMTVTTGIGGEPDFLGPDGEPLTVAEAQALAEMFEIANEGLEFLLAYVVFLGASLG